MKFKDLKRLQVAMNRMQDAADRVEALANEYGDIPGLRQLSREVALTNGLFRGTAKACGVTVESKEAVA